MIALSSTSRNDAGVVHPGVIHATGTLPLTGFGRPEPSEPVRPAPLWESGPTPPLWSAWESAPTHPCAGKDSSSHYLRPANSKWAVRDSAFRGNF